jgi:cyclopropane fatty-acyl-phospholipid synthase-like methyltransferase
MTERAQAAGARVGQGSEVDVLYGEDYYRRQLHREHWFRDNRRKHEMRWEAVLRLVQPTATDRVLDVGCAAGEHALRMAPLVARVTAIDSSPAAIALARRRGRGIGNVEFIEQDATRLDGIADETVDKIMAIDFIEHVGDAELRRLLAVSWRVLRQGGRVAIYTPCLTHYVERLKARNLILRQIPGHVAVRTPAHCEKVFGERAWAIADRFFLPSTYPLFGRLDRLLSPLPGLGGLFRFRYCVALEKPVSA